MDYGLFGGLKPEPELVAVTNGVEQGAAAASHAAPLYAQSGAGPGAGFPGGVQLADFGFGPNLAASDNRPSPREGRTPVRQQPSPSVPGPGLAFHQQQQQQQWQQQQQQQFYSSPGPFQGQGGGIPQTNGSSGQFFSPIHQNLGTGDTPVSSYQSLVDRVAMSRQQQQYDFQQSQLALQGIQQRLREQLQLSQQHNAHLMREMREKDRELHTVSQQPHADFSLQNSRLAIQDDKIDDLKSSMSQMLDLLKRPDPVVVGPVRVVTRCEPEVEISVVDSGEAEKTGYGGKALGIQEEADKARALFQSAPAVGLPARMSIPKSLIDGSSVTASFKGNVGEDVKTFLNLAKQQMVLLEPLYWVHIVHSKCLGPRVLKMSELQQKDLKPDRHWTLDAGGNKVPQPGGIWGGWEEFSAWMIKEFYKPEMELAKSAKFLFESKQTRSFQEFASEVQLQRGQLEETFTDSTIKNILFRGMRPQTYNRIKVDPDLMNGDLKDLIRIAGKLDEVEYEASRGGKISAVEFDASEPDVAELCREIPVLVGGKKPYSGPPAFSEAWHDMFKHSSHTHCNWCHGNHSITLCWKLWWKKMPGKAMPADMKAVFEKPENQKKYEVAGIEIRANKWKAFLADRMSATGTQAQGAGTWAEREGSDVPLPVLCSSEDDLNESDDEDDEILGLLDDFDFGATKEQLQEFLGSLAGVKIEDVTLQTEKSENGGLRFFLKGTFGGVEARIMLDSGAEVNTASCQWVDDNIQSLQVFLKKCAPYGCAGVAEAPRMMSNRILGEIPVVIQDFEDVMSLKVLPMGGGHEYDIILGIPWIKAYTEWAKPIVIKGKARRLCIDSHDRLIASIACNSSELPELPHLGDGAIEPGLFKMSPVSLAPAVL